jgi:hypothetical protein
VGRRRRGRHHPSGGIGATGFRRAYDVVGSAVDVTLLGAIVLYAWTWSKAVT